MFVKNMHVFFFQTQNDFENVEIQFSIRFGKIWTFIENINISVM